MGAAAYCVQPVAAPLDAVVEVPGSKSIANRALVCAALCDDVTTVHHVPDGDDTAALLDCLDRLGFPVERDETSVRVQGGAQRMRPGPVELPSRLAGTTSRFVTALAALGPGPYVVDGDEPLRVRPMGPLHDALRALGAEVVAKGEPGRLPVQVAAGELRQRPRPEARLRGDVSSQYLTALMLIGPCMRDGLVVHLTTPLVSRPYVELTAAVMAAFGATDVEVGEHDVRVGGTGYHSPGAYTVEPDASSASYPLAAAAVCGGRVEVDGLTSTSLQGDAVFADVLATMGCVATRGTASTAVRRDGPLHGIDVDMVDHSDLVPSLAVVAAFAASPTRIRGVGFIRAKESDRIGDLCTELRRAGIAARETDDGLVVEPSTPHGALLEPHHDHRLAMAGALVGLRVPGICIADPGVVAKSWPGFWTALEALR